MMPACNNFINLYFSSQNHEEIRDVIKPYDWTYSTSYQGTSSNEFINTEQTIDIERLKQLEPILFYDENILFEDELADNGTATLTTRLVSRRDETV
jgi:type 2A phosphatase activator TIP41